MFARLGLRFRIFLFFALIGLGCAAIAGGALYYGWARAVEPVAAAPFVTAFVLFLFLHLGLVVGIWLLFDENVAKPIERLATQLRLRVNSGVDTHVDKDFGRYLGDLAPAAQSISSEFSASVLKQAEDVARETEKLNAETARLAALLSEIPVAVILVNPAWEIVLYDGQAATLLERFAPLRLRAPLTDYFSADSLAAARAVLGEAMGEATLPIETANNSHRFDAHFKPVGNDSYLLTIECETAPALSATAPRPMIYDFDLLAPQPTGSLENSRLDDLCFVVFDCETTGLSTDTDEVIQMGALRILNGKIVEGEVFDTYVNPGRPIPPSSTEVHGITDSDVATSPSFAEAGRAFHNFARDAVLVAHNAPFDVAFLRRFEAEMGVKWQNPVLDTVLLSAACFGTTEDHSLDGLCARLAVSFAEGTRHTAYGDAQATAAVLLAMIPLLGSRSITTFAEARAECRRHHRLLKSVDLES